MNIYGYDDVAIKKVINCCVQPSSNKLNIHKEIFSKSLNATMWDFNDTEMKIECVLN